MIILPYMGCSGSSLDFTSPITGRNTIICIHTFTINTPSPSGRSLFSFPKNPTVSRFHSVWVQGVVVYSDVTKHDKLLVLDDGTGPPVVLFVNDKTTSTHSFRQGEFLNSFPKAGDYVGCVGEVVGSGGVGTGAGDNNGTVVNGTDTNTSRITPARYALRAVRLHDLSNEPDREAMWNVEVVEAFRVLELAGLETE